MMNVPAVSGLSDDLLLQRLTELLATSNHNTALLLQHLAEVDTRRLYLREGCSSLFRYCVEVLHMPENAAYRRITAARFGRRFPVIVDRIAAGELHLGGIALLAPHLTGENHVELLAAAKHRTMEEIRRLIADRAPKPDVAPRVRALPSPQPGALLLAAASAPAPPNHTGSTPASSLVGKIDPTVTAPAIAAAPRPAVLVPIAPRRYQVTFTASAEVHDKLRRAQALLRHQIPDGDLNVVLDRALTALLASLESSRFAATAAPRPSAPEPNATGSRHIPAAVKRAVVARDGEQCAFVSPRGTRCTERGFLEFHHIVPFARRGRATVANISLRCRAHNQYEAVLDFGGAARPPRARETATAYATGTFGRDSRDSQRCELVTGDDTRAPDNPTVCAATAAAPSL
jgi:hypothetical protein